MKILLKSLQQSARHRLANCFTMTPHDLTWLDFIPCVTFSVGYITACLHYFVHNMIDRIENQDTFFFISKADSSRTVQTSEEQVQLSTGGPCDQHPGNTINRHTMSVPCWNNQTLTVMKSELRYWVRKPAIWSLKCHSRFCAINCNALQECSFVNHGLQPRE